MGKYSRFISEARRALPTPENLVDGEGRCVFGTFQGEFPRMDLVRAKKPTHAPQWMNKKKLTLWEACEVHFREGVLLTAVCDMGLFGTDMVLFYEKETGQVYAWSETLSSAGAKIAPNLLDDTTTSAETKNGFLKFVNDFGKGRAKISGSQKNGRDTLQYDIRLEKVCEPSVVSIPFGPNRPLYSEKQFFRAEGTLCLNGRSLVLDRDATAVIDDHRGYYPRHAHYDWTATMGHYHIGDAKKYFSLNLTANQSIDPERYNENLIFLEQGNSLLPPVSFSRSIASAAFKGHSEWTIRDGHDMVNAVFRVKAQHAMVVHALAVKIDYYVCFGELSGYVRDEDGNAVILDGMTGIGEDKTLLF